MNRSTGSAAAGQNPKIVTAMGVILAAVPTLILIGINTWFSTCGPKDDGSYMACHWAGRAVAAAAAMALVLAVLRFVLRDRMVKAGLDMALAASGVLMMLIPGRVINLCMMEDMMCRSHTQPWTMILSAILVIAAVADLFFVWSGVSADHHRRDK